MLGISVYLSDIDYEYLEYASSLGVRYIFTSLHIPEEDLSDLEIVLPQFLKVCESLEMEIIPDISPYTFEKLGLDNNDFKGLKSKGFSMVRLDYGFEDISLVKEISSYFRIILNASLVDASYIQDLIDIDFNLENIHLMHNFYPRQDTGLDDTYFEKLNVVHQTYGLETSAFVVGDRKKRLPLFEGLPTLERHRNTNPYVAGVELMKNHGIDMILIGDNQAKYTTLQFLSEFMENGVVTLPAYLNQAYTYLYDKVIEIRQDTTKSLVRLKLERKLNIPQFENNHRNAGSIVIDNQIAGRYSGEVQLVVKTMSFTSRSNNIGWVHPEYVDLLKYLDNSIKIKFVEIALEH